MMMMINTNNKPMAPTNDNIAIKWHINKTTQFQILVTKESTFKYSFPRSREKMTSENSIIFKMQSRPNQINYAQISSQTNKHVASKKSRPKVGMIVCVWYTLFFNKRNQWSQKQQTEQRNYSKSKAIYS